jgi:hypothetical protein
MRSSLGGAVEEGPRHVAAEGLPSVDEVIASVQRAHHIDRLADLGVVELTGQVQLESRHMQGEVSLLFDADRSRIEIGFDAVREVGVVEGGRAWSYSTPTGLDELDGMRREQALLDRFPVTLGDWRNDYEHVEVLKRIQAGDDSVLLVRVVPKEALGSTIFVHEASGRVVIVDGLVQIPGLGVVGVRTRFGDFQDVGGMLLPYRTVADFATPMIGRVITQLKHAELGIQCRRKELRRRPGRGPGC